MHAWAWVHLCTIVNELNMHSSMCACNTNWTGVHILCIYDPLSRGVMFQTSYTFNCCHSSLSAAAQSRLTSHRRCLLLRLTAAFLLLFSIPGTFLAYWGRPLPDIFLKSYFNTQVALKTFYRFSRIVSVLKEFFWDVLECFSYWSRGIWSKMSTYTKCNLLIIY